MATTTATHHSPPSSIHEPDQQQLPLDHSQPIPSSPTAIPPSTSTTHSISPSDPPPPQLSTQPSTTLPSSPTHPSPISNSSILPQPPPQSPSATPTTQDQDQDQDQDLSTNLSPQVLELASIFPQIQPTILEAVLAAHGNQPAECVNDLLAMSDPSWKPSSQDAMVRSDAELARQLAFQDAQQPAAEQPMNLPYQPRIKKPGPPRPSQLASHSDGRQSQTDPSAGLSPGGKDEIQKIADELSKLAETGKKTMTSWLSKARMKMQEMQQQPQPGPSSSASPASESLDAYEHVSAPSPAEMGRPSSTRSNRITPTLPYASRYQTAPTRSPTTTTSTVSQSQPAEGYKLNESSSTNIGHTGNSLGETGQGGTHHLPPSSMGAGSGTGKGAQRIRDEDEESLEYTRNPFEDDD